ncbi:MAG: hypothetical protein H6737_12800 [Alphaproteobacteria bacterium]|nr:hypothetical protein [Alphaproteobacteria bacterium]
MVMLALLALTGCDALNKAKDTIDGLLDPVVVEGIVLGVEPPQSQELQDLLTGSEFDSGTTATIFMADAKEVQEIENAPISGANVTLTGPGVNATVSEIDSGIYVMTPADQPVEYASGDTWELKVVRSSGDQTATSTAQILLPEPADFTAQIPQQHQNNTPITLDFTGLPYDSALVVVVDDGGNVTYSNEPSTIKEVYDFTHGQSTLGVITIPGEAFPADGVYAVGVAGMVNTDAADLDEMNTGLSSIVSGLMKMYAVNTYPLPI